MVVLISASVSSLITRRRVAHVSRQQSETGRSGVGDGGGYCDGGPWLISYSRLDGGFTLVEEGESDRLSSLHTAACPARIMFILVWPCGRLFVSLVELRQARVTTRTVPYGIGNLGRWSRRESRVGPDGPTRRPRYP